ncbi:DUF5666 domain-containing protein [Variovorax sp. E3]|uniref:DUF5666 domain-containing protein n=1 Tax=Variovorax sp. E3 TaxID=1914993 RepID=UPI0022B6EE50|nr:DUF5666 domain-containing protein [Variovorax sp. E3]
MLGLLSGGAIALLLSCGGGGGGGSGSGLGTGTGVVAPSAAGGGDSAAGNGAGTGTGTGTGTSADGAGSGSGSAGASGGTSTAGNGGTDGSGVGSGGTGVTADAAGIGAADGLGSIILNGLRYNTDNATFSIEDATELQIGMSARVAGKVDANFTSGVATQVMSAAELRGAASGVDTGAGTFVVMGTTVSIDSATVWGDANGLADVRPANIVQVWGLPGAPGTLRATRVLVTPALTEPLATGTVQNLDTLHKTFVLGQLTVDYSAAAFPGIAASSLANGVIVRARGVAPPVAGILAATTVQAGTPFPWSMASRSS